MQEIVNYSPYVYACRTGQNSSTKIFHLFVLVPIARRKFISLLNRPKADIKGGFSFKPTTQGIHFQIGTRNMAFGDKIMSNGQTFWATYLSFEYAAGNHISESENYTFDIHIHKDRDGQPDRTISLVYDEVEELNEATFHEIKDGEIALNCPYLYVDQNVIDATPVVLVPEIKKLEVLTEPITDDVKKTSTTTILKSSTSTSTTTS